MDNCQRGVVFNPIGVSDADGYGEVVNIAAGGWYPAGGATFCGVAEGDGANVVEIYDKCKFRVIATKVLL